MIVKDLGLVGYEETYHAMREFTAQRTAETEDELWLLEHPAVFTQGLNGKAEHILQTNDVPIVETDRGGQVTYHGPGQLIGYTLIDLKRQHIGVREMVSRLEAAVIDMLASFNIPAEARADAPGVYVKGCKIASLGLRIKKGGCYHGVSINVDMDLSPFKMINPCGLIGMEVTDFNKLGCPISMTDAKQLLVEKLNKQMKTQ